MQCVALMGPPGGGKDTQVNTILPIFRDAFYLFSTGKALERLPPDHPYHLARATGEQFPDEQMVEVVRNDLALAAQAGRFDPAYQHVFFNGFYRTPRQVDLGVEHFDIVAAPVLEVSRSVALARLRNRLDESLAQGGIPRAEDNEASFQKRLDHYEQYTIPAICRMEELGIPVYRINGEQERTRVAKDLLHVLSRALGHR